MRNTGITRPVDRMGRIVIPKEIRDQLNLQEKDRFFFLVQKEGEKNIVLKQVKNSCVLCNSTKNLEKIDGNLICSDCIEKVSTKN